MAGMPIEDINERINSEIAKFKGEKGVHPVYRSDTSDEYFKYSTTINSKFSSMSKKKKRQHILKLYRTLYNKARGCNICIT
jgi:hypothetical protein